ncbi:hypothetical protein K445DRAFT_80321 [Daldinia sp. EC12]|nr:hypothetical protein K445DRAFT_80321 [Daldinia sp. EC12]
MRGCRWLCISGYHDTSQRYQKTHVVPSHLIRYRCSHGRRSVIGPLHEKKKVAAKTGWNWKERNGNKPMSGGGEEGFCFLHILFYFILFFFLVWIKSVGLLLAFSNGGQSTTLMR